MTGVARYAVLTTEEQTEQGFMAAMMTGQQPEKQRVGRLIRSVDGGATWTLVELKSEERLRFVADMLTREAQERAVAEFRFSIDTTKGEEQ